MLRFKQMSKEVRLHFIACDIKELKNKRDIYDLSYCESLDEVIFVDNQLCEIGDIFLNLN